MDLYHHESARGNFGDDLNLWIWDGLLPGWRDWDPEAVLVGVGTLLSSTFIDREAARPRRYLVAGSGVGYGDGRTPDVSDKARWDVRCLRGPRSARSLGLPEEMGVLDPAVMLADFPEFQAIPKAGPPIFVPHESTVVRHDWTRACAEAGLDYVSPRGDAKEIVGRIAGAPLVLAESMHAAIIADAFRTPWIALRIGPKFHLDKWRDWAASLAIPLHDVPPLFPVEERLFALPRATLAALRARRGAALAAAPRVGADHDRPPGRIARLQHGIEARHVAAALRRHMRRPPSLSNPSKLAAQMNRYRDVLEGVRHDYA
jgi:succinoglycan biosynthesis protein ExoV